MLTEPPHYFLLSLRQYHVAELDSSGGLMNYNVKTVLIGLFLSLLEKSNNENLLNRTRQLAVVSALQLEAKSYQKNEFKKLHIKFSLCEETVNVVTNEF